ncbi:MAG: thermonuclease family protein [Proteobacteria bacterium]|nr:thermonuclease family protein [Pseudomonadota bacterium]MDA1133178.1 thermonuclease family protein [Pseudomonadota bacterium]
MRLYHLFLFAAGLLLPAAAQAQDVTGIAAVLQADQIVIDRLRVNIYGIDAPDPDMDRQCTLGRQFFGCYSNAKRQMEILVDEGPVTCSPTGEVNYIGFPYMTCRTASGEDIGDAMVRAGVALAFLPQSDMYAEVEAEAREAKRGIWQDGIRFALPWEWRVMNSRPTFGP